MNTDDYAKIRAAAIAYLHRREHSRAELCAKLRRRFEARDLVDQVVAELVAQSWQSDQRFADSLVRQRSQRGYGPRRIQVELQAKGVTADRVNFQANEDEEGQSIDWVKLARQALQKRFGDQPADNLQDRAKRYRFLAQRGFGADQIQAALNGQLDQD